MLLEILETGKPSHRAIVVAGGGTTLSYERLRQQVEHLATELNSLGINPRDRVAIALPNGIEMIVSFLAATSTATGVPLNPGYKLEEFSTFSGGYFSARIDRPGKGNE